MIIGGLEFEQVAISFSGVYEYDVFAKRRTPLGKVLSKPSNNKKYDTYSKARTILSNEIEIYAHEPIGDVLLRMKNSGDNRYTCVLNKYGDLTFSTFKIEEGFSRGFKGLYAYTMDEELKYIGRCRDDFLKRVNNGYGKIDPYNCYRNGQATNCHINSLITDKIKSGTVNLYVHKCSDDDVIVREEIRLINHLKKLNSEIWNLKF
jgi:hypothetical protein